MVTIIIIVTQIQSTLTREIQKPNNMNPCYQGHASCEGSVRHCRNVSSSAFLAILGVGWGCNSHLVWCKPSVARVRTLCCKFRFVGSRLLPAEGFPIYHARAWPRPYFEDRRPSLANISCCRANLFGSARILQQSCLYLHRYGHREVDDRGCRHIGFVL